jgi:hypothetical protein
MRIAISTTMGEGHLLKRGQLENLAYHKDSEKEMGLRWREPYRQVK